MTGKIKDLGTGNGKGDGNGEKERENEGGKIRGRMMGRAKRNCLGGKDGEKGRED